MSESSVNEGSSNILLSYLREVSDKRYQANKDHAEAGEVLPVVCESMI